MQEGREQMNTGEFQAVAPLGAVTQFGSGSAGSVWLGWAVSPRSTGEARAD